MQKRAHRFGITLAMLAASFSIGFSMQGKPGQAASANASASAGEQSKSVLEANVKAEWDAFQKKDKKAYSDLLAEDFEAVEDDGQGLRTKSAAVSEVDRSVINRYYLFALKVTPINADAALVKYELTMQFPPQAQVRLKRVLVSELWLQRDRQWKLRYYQETHVR